MEECKHAARAVPPASVRAARLATLCAIRLAAALCCCCMQVQHPHTLACLRCNACVRGMILELDHHDTLPPRRRGHSPRARCARHLPLLCVQLLPPPPPLPAARPHGAAWLLGGAGEPEALPVAAARERKADERLVLVNILHSSSSSGGGSGGRA